MEIALVARTRKPRLPLAGSGRTLCTLPGAGAFEALQKPHGFRLLGQADPAILPPKEARP